MIQAPPGTLTERYKYGTRLRAKAPRQKHADLHGSADRDPVAILAATDRTRVPELVPVRYERMLASPFTFLRGAAAVMAEDLRHQPSAGIPVQACGDCHLMNFGAFATPEQNILFDINDFDETLLGVDFTADLKRLAASVAVAALAANLSKGRAKSIAAISVESYRTRMRNLAKLSDAGMPLHLAGSLKRTHSQFQNIKTYDVEIRTLDEFRLADVRFIKADVEGSEREVLDGARATIARDRPIILLELLAAHSSRPGRLYSGDLRQFWL